MKTLFKILSALICYLLTFPAFGQELDGFKAFVSAGVNTSQMDGDGYSGFNKFNPVVGIGIQKPLNEKYQLQLELTYLRKGSFKPERPDKGSFNTYKISLDYIEVPILFQFKYKKVQLELGPGIGYLFKTKEEDNAGVVPKSGFDWKPFEIDALFGLGYAVTDQLSLQCRIHRSILSVSRGETVTPFGRFGGAYNTVIAGGVKYTFNFQ